MKLIKIITNRDIVGGTEEFLSQTSRESARGVLIDADGNVAMMYMSKCDLYKLPGGGVEGGESIEEAFLREIKDETGFVANINRELGYVEEHKIQNDFMQLSYCYLASIEGESLTTALTPDELELGMELQWMSLHEAIKQMKQAFEKCNDYSDKFMLLRDRLILEEVQDLQLNDEYK